MERMTTPHPSHVAALWLVLAAGPAWPESAVVCVGINDTAAIQEAVDKAPFVSLVGQTCMIDARVGIRIPSDRTIDATGATFTILPACQPRCKAFETIVGSRNIRFLNGTIIGDVANVSGVEWRIGWRVDGADHVEVIGTTFQNWRTDGVWVGGNVPGSRNVRLSQLLIEGSGRNHISVSCGSHIRIERGVLRDIQTVPGKSKPDPGAGIDIEPNPGELVTDLVISEVESYNNVKGIFVQPGHGGPCVNCYVRDNTVAGNSEWGIAVNSVDGGGVTQNRVSGSPIGITIGGATEAMRARNLVVADNVVEACTIGIRLPGIRDSEVVRNVHPGPITKPALGDAGDMLYRGNVQR